MCLDFIDPLQSQLFYQLPANIVHILKNTCKEIVCNGCVTGEKINFICACEISMNTSICTINFANWLEKLIF